MWGRGIMCVLVVAAAACSGGSDEVVRQPDVTTPVATEPADDFSVSEPDAVASPEYADGPLVDVCPPTISIQTAALPGVSVGPLHLLLGNTSEVAQAGAVVAGPLTRVDGTVEAVRLEIRSGGPSVGFRSPLTLLNSDESIFLAHASSAAAALASTENPTTAVVTLTEATHRAFMWDPATYPDITSLNDLRNEGVEIRHITDDPVIDFLVDLGELDADQAVAGFDGEPAAFVGAGGTIAQLGDLLVDPPLFESLSQWGRPVGTLSPADAGWVGHDDTLAIRRSELEGASACLGRLVPLIQEAIVSYASDPAPTNEAMALARAEANPLTRISADLMNEGAQDGVDAGVFANGANDTVGDFDASRLGPFFDTLLSPDGADSEAAAGLFTNDFIDPSIGL